VQAGTHIANMPPADATVVFNKCMLLIKVIDGSEDDDDGDDDVDEDEEDDEEVYENNEDDDADIEPTPTPSTQPPLSPYAQITSKRSRTGDKCEFDDGMSPNSRRIKRLDRVRRRLFSNDEYEEYESS